MGHREDFEASGFLALRRAIPTQQLAPVRQYVLDELKRLKIRTDGKGGASAGDARVFQQVSQLSQRLKFAGLRERLVTPAVLSLLSELTDGRTLASQEAQLLVSPPRQGEWTLQRLNWHTDVAPAAGGHSPGVQLFALLDDVAEHGGGTLALSGSHRLARGMHGSGTLLAQLRGDAPLTDVLAKHGLSLLEMSGHAGDVFIMDLRLIHSPSVNASARPRIMATTRYFLSA